MSRVLGASLALGLVALPLTAAAAGADGAHAWCGTSRWGAETAVFEHREDAARRGVRPASVGAAADVGQIAVLQDAGDLVLPRHLLDLQGVGLQFTPGPAGFTVSRVDRPVASEAGTPLALTDDSNVAVSLPFPFPYFGQTYTRAFVNSDGNLTFGRGESASTPRNLGRLVGGPPRIAPLFTDLDPGAGGSITTSGDASHFSVTWTHVPEYGAQGTNTFQVTLHPDGRVEFALDRDLDPQLEEGVVGVAPGAGRNGLITTTFRTAAGATGPGAIAESFHSKSTLDPVAVARKFYATHPDDYQQLVIFTSQPIGRFSYFAYELTVKNTDSGIGDDLKDFSAEFGSAGRLESFVTMDYVGKYPDDPLQVFFGTDSALSIMGQEVGHRWGAYARFKDGQTVSDELLGRDEAHWSFFMDSDASHLEGNDIEDLGGGSFRTVAATQRYCPLDQYLMGVRPAAEVPPFFFIRNPVTDGGTGRGRPPEVGVSIQGTRKDVAIGDVIAALGPRNPAPAAKPPFREAFVYVDAGVLDAATGVAKVDRFRAAWGPFFARSMDGRWSVDTRLR